MNIWALDKDVAIKSMLLMLRERLGEKAFVVLQDEQMDSCRVRLASPMDEVITACIHTYEKGRGCYRVDLEYPEVLEISLCEQVDSYPNVDFDQLVAMVSAHLDIA